MYPRCSAPRPTGVVEVPGRITALADHGDEVADSDVEPRDPGVGHPDPVDEVADLAVGHADLAAHVADLAGGVVDLVDEVRDLVFGGDECTIDT